MIIKHVKPETTIITDLLKSYFGLFLKGFTHFTVNHVVLILLNLLRLLTLKPWNCHGQRRSQEIILVGVSLPGGLEYPPGKLLITTKNAILMYFLSKIFFNMFLLTFLSLFCRFKLSK